LALALALALQSSSPFQLGMEWQWIDQPKEARGFLMTCRPQVWAGALAIASHASWPITFGT